MNCKRVQFISHARLLVAVQSLAYCLKDLTDVVTEKKAIQHHFLPGAEQFVKRLRDIWIIAEENLVMERDILPSRECVHWQEGKFYVVILDEGIVFFVIEGNAYIILCEKTALCQSLISHPADKSQLIWE